MFISCVHELKTSKHGFISYIHEFETSIHGFIPCIHEFETNRHGFISYIHEFEASIHECETSVAQMKAFFISVGNVEGFNCVIFEFVPYIWVCTLCIDVFVTSTQYCGQYRRMSIPCVYLVYMRLCVVCLAPGIPAHGFEPSLMGEGFNIASVFCPIPLHVK